MSTEVSVERLELARGILERYSRIREDGQVAENEWRGHVRAAAEAVYPREKEMYDRLAKEPLAKFMASYQWRKIVDELLHNVHPYEASTLLIQHYVKGKPLKNIIGARGRTMSKATVAKYKKVGLREFGVEVERVLSQLREQEKILYGN